jgi:hypothetical protein
MATRRWPHHTEGYAGIKAAATVRCNSASPVERHAAGVLVSDAQICRSHRSHQGLEAQMRLVQKLPPGKLLVAAALAILLSGGWWWWSSWYFKPAPSFSVGLFDHGPTNFEKLKSEVTSRLLARFPLGSPEAVLETELAREGFGRKIQWRDSAYSQYSRHTGWLETEVTTVRWRADENRNLAALDGTVFRDANVP